MQSQTPRLSKLNYASLYGPITALSGSSDRTLVGHRAAGSTISKLFTVADLLVGWTEPLVEVILIPGFGILDPTCGSHYSSIMQLPIFSRTTVVALSVLPHMRTTQRSIRPSPVDPRKDYR